MKKLLFADNMPKLCDQNTATLVYWTAMAGCQLKQHQDFWLYDTLKSDGTFYKLNKDGRYLVLFFVGDKGILFSTIRKLNDENRHYLEEVGEVFNIEVVTNDTNER